MKTIYIRGGDKDSPGVYALKYHLKAKGHEVVRSREEKHDRIVCWGVSTRELNAPKPSLNGNVNLYNKLQALTLFAKADVPVPTILGLEPSLTQKRLFNRTKPWFGRRIHHEKGKDIVVCNVWDEVENTVEYRQADYFSVYIPHTHELRVWTFRGKALAVYHKQYKEPGIDNYKRLEFRSELRDDLLEDKHLCQYAVDAIKALKMDWGAVDILRGEDGEDYVLEVNSMPDISSTERVSGIRLASAISKWAENV